MSRRIHALFHPLLCRKRYTFGGSGPASPGQFTCNSSRCNWAGQGAAAFPRTVMLEGGDASMVSFDLAAADETLGGMLHVDLDGPPPPPGMPNYYAQFNDDAWG